MKRLLFLSALFYLTIAVVLVMRIVAHLNTPSEPRHENLWALKDYRDTVYFPVVSMLEGQNPYDSEHFLSRYPVDNSFPLYSPGTLVVHAPFGLLPFQVSEFLYLAILFALLPVMVGMGMRVAKLQPKAATIFWISGFLLLSRPGYWNAMLGQSTVTLGLGLYLSLFYARSKPWLAGVGLALTCLKPTVGAPLVLLTLVNGAVPAALMGVGFSAILALIAIVPLSMASQGFGAFIESVKTAHEVWSQNPEVNAGSSPFRSDLSAFIGRLTSLEIRDTSMILLSLGILGVSALALRRLRRSPHEEARVLASMILCLVAVACFYHQAYDLLFLTMPALAIIGGTYPSPDESDGVRRFWRWGMGGVLSLAAINHFRNPSIVHLLGLDGPSLLVVESINGAAVFVLLAGLWWASFRLRLDVPTESRTRS